MIKASLVHKGAFIRSIIVRSISIYNNDFDELIRPVILLLLENLKKDKSYYNFGNVICVENRSDSAIERV